MASSNNPSTSNPFLPNSTSYPGGVQYGRDDRQLAAQSADVSALPQLLPSHPELLPNQSRARSSANDGERRTSQPGRIHYGEDNRQMIAHSADVSALPQLLPSNPQLLPNQSTARSSANDGERNTGRLGGGRIRKVLPLLRSHSSNKGLFDPRVVSIGPYHDGKTELEAAEAIKPLVVEMFLHPPNSLREDIYSINYDYFDRLIKARISYARSFYDEGSTADYSDDDFTAMMILDGFFVLALLQSFPSDQIGFNVLVASTLGRNALGMLHNDVVALVENQIPFPILELLMNSTFQDPDKGMQIITTYFSSMLSWKIAVPKGGGVNYAREVKASDIIAKSPAHLMEVFWLCQYGLDHEHADDDEDKKKNKKKKNSVATHAEDVLYYFSSVTELKDMGINVAPSASLSPSAIDFKSGFLFGQLELPPCIFSDDDNRQDANMMAYEYSSSHLGHLPATAYITFLKSLMNTPEDVRELRSKKVLFATGISDEKVLEIVQGTATFGFNDYYFYNHVKERIHKHCNRKWKTWMAELIHDYFRNPWTVIALVAATCLLVLTFIQTYFTVKQ